MNITPNGIRGDYSTFRFGSASPLLVPAVLVLLRSLLVLLSVPPALSLSLSSSSSSTKASSFLRTSVTFSTRLHGTASSSSTLGRHHHSMEESGTTVRHHGPFAASDDGVATLLVVLNRPVVVTDDDDVPSLFDRLWASSRWRVCADGGANRLYDASGGRLTPDVIVGDLDSLRDDVRACYEARGCRVVSDPDQDSNDLDKALHTARALSASLCAAHTTPTTTTTPTPPPRYRICVYGAFGGRFDQTMASIQALHRWPLAALSHHHHHHHHQRTTECTDLVLYTEETSARLLPPGVVHHLHLDRDHEGPACGLIPVGARCDVAQTNGLQWELTDDTGPMEFGGLVSSSNIVVRDVVRVECSQALVWTTEMRGFGGVVSSATSSSS